jgi:hypothetical protein
MCGYFLNATDSNPVLMSGYLVNDDGSPGETLLMRTLPLTDFYDYDDFYGNGSIHFKELRNTIADILIVSAVDGAAETVRKGQLPIAQECVLSWCVKTIHSSYDWGRYTEEIIKTVYNTTQGPSPWVSTPFQTAFQNGTDNFYLQNVSISVETAPGDQNISSYGMLNNTAAAIIQGFIDIFPAVTTWNNESSPPLMRYKTWSQGPAWQRVLDFNPWLAPNNVSRHMERLAIAMTNVVRSASSNEMLPGKAFSRQTYVSIKWGWLAFPFALLILSLVFLVSTIIKTSGDGATGVWKTSAMPTLIYSLPKETQTQFASSSTWSSGKGASHKTRIRLLPNMGWRVSGHSQASRSPRLPTGEKVPRGWI